MSIWSLQEVAEHPEYFMTVYLVLNLCFSLKDSKSESTVVRISLECERKMKMSNFWYAFDIIVDMLLQGFGRFF